MPDIDDAVVQGLYEAAAGTTPWNVALGGLHDVVGASSAQLFVVDKTSGRMTLHENSQRSPVDAMFDYVREYHRIDPHVEFANTLPVGTVFNTRNLFPAKVYATHPFFLEQWTGHKVRAVLGAKAAEDEHHVAFVGVTRQTDFAFYSHRDEELMRRYVGHLGAALRIAKHVSILRTQAIVGVGLMQSSSRAMFLLSQMGEMLATNDHAQALLAEGNPFIARGNILQCQGGENGQTLAEVIQELSAARSRPGGQTQRRRAALRLRKTNGSVMLCSLWEMQPESTMGVFGTQPAVLLTVAQPQGNREVDAIWLGSLFDLTPAEVRIALALMRGESVRDIARAHRLSQETIRSQVKSICAKTDTHRQVELVELLLRVAAL